MGLLSLIRVTDFNEFKPKKYKLEDLYQFLVL